ncbi:MAG: sterol desaturase family protein [Nitrospiraceae bacterium]
MNADTLTEFAKRVLNHLLEPWSSWENFSFAISAGARTFRDFTSEFGWPYLLSTLALMGVLFVLGRRNRTIDGGSFLNFACPRNIYRHPSAILDYKFAAINSSTDLLLVAPLITGISLLVYNVTVHVFSGPWSLKDTFTSHHIATTVALLSQLLILGDFVYFISHYLMHKVPFLWTFHQVHHSAEVLTPISVARVHPVERLFQAIVRALCGGVGTGLYTSASDVHVSIGTLFGVNIVLFFFLSFAYNLRHSHIWLSYGPVLSWVLVSPAQHQIHHSREPKHLDKNFGLVFSFWDAAFGSLYIPQTRESLKYGLAGVPQGKFATVQQLYFTPLVEASHILLHAPYRYFVKAQDKIKTSRILELRARLRWLGNRTQAQR